MAADAWLKMGQVLALWKAADLPGEVSTVRRMIDDGAFGEVHRTRGGYRMVRRSAVESAISSESEKKPK